MAFDYRTSDGDMLDDIVYRHYGTTSGGIVEIVMNANHGLASLGATLPAGVLVHLPDIEPPSDEGISLWT